MQISHVKKLTWKAEALSFAGPVALPFPISAFVTDLHSAHGGWDALPYEVIIITLFFLIRGGEKTSGNAIKEWLTAVALCRPRHLRVSSDCSVKTQLSRKKDHSCGFQRFEVRARGGDFSRGESPLTEPLSRLMTSGFTPVGLYWLSQHLNASTLFVNSHCPKPLNTHISLIADPGDPQVPAPATGQPRLWLVVTCAILDKI